MESPGSKIAVFRAGLNGLLSKEAPDLLSDGQYRTANNIVAQQEGSICSRNGIKLINYFTASEPVCYIIRKLCVYPGVEDPLTPSSNPRYVGCLTSGSERNIYRTLDYAAKTQVATNVDTDAKRHWEMADYAASESGTAWAYFACPNGMYKDRGSAPYPTLHKWGIQPATGVCLAIAVTGNVTIAAINWGLNGSGVVITTTSKTGLSDLDEVTITGVPQGGADDIVITTTDGTTDINHKWAVRIGWPDAEGNIVNPDTMFRIYDTNGKQVESVTDGAIPVGGGQVTGVPALGNLDGGAESSRPASQPYDWVTVWEESDTGDKGNPSQFMSKTGIATLNAGGISYSCQPLKVHNGTAKVVIWNSDDPQVGFIRVYRRGGVLFDTHRLVARIACNAPGWAADGAFQYYIITDNTADSDIVYNELLETDNDPPVVSTVPSPISSTATGSFGPGWNGVTLTNSVFGKVTRGTLVHVIDAQHSEDVYCANVVSTGFSAYFQHTHVAGVAIEVNAITGQNCNLVATIGEATLVAGDINNPHMLYKSKTGAPQAFPVGVDMAGAVTSIGVGTPANGIVNLTECRGQALCLNVSSLFEVAILSGSLTQPVKVSGKGLKGQSAWCKTETEEIWFLSDDGVYSWDGASTVKRSEAIDPLFHSMEFNGMSPLNMNADALASARMEFRRGMVYLAYKAIDGHTRGLICQPFYKDRWMATDGGVVGVSEFPITAMYTEPDTKSLVIAVSNPTGPTAVFGILDVSVVYGGENHTSDWWTGTADAGNFIAWEVTLPWFDLGSPATLKLFEEVWLDIDPMLMNPGLASGLKPSMTADLYLNYDDTVVETFQVQANPVGSALIGRHLVSLLPNLKKTSGSINQSYGREARAISFRLSGFAIPRPFTLYRVLIQFQDTGLLTAGAAGDWMDLGSKHDKRLYQMTVIFDSAGTNRQIVFEPLGGREGKTLGTAQVFTLSAPTDLGNNRCMKVFPMRDATVGKLFRVRPYASAPIDAVPVVLSGTANVFGAGATRLTGPDWTSAWIGQTITFNGNPGTIETVVDKDHLTLTSPLGIFPGATWSFTTYTTNNTISSVDLFRIHEVTWPDAEEYPPDIVTRAGGFTNGKVTEPWTKGGYDFEKYANQLAFEVNTNDVPVTVLVQADGATIGLPLTIRTTDIDRKRNITLSPNLKGIAWSIFVDPNQPALTTDVGMFQLFNLSWKFQQYDPGEVGHTFAWDDLGHPYDKLLTTIDIEYDTTNGGPMTLQMDTLSGINGADIHLNVARFALGNGRGKTEYPIAPDTVAKMVRVYPAGSVNVGYRQWKYLFQKIDYPADTVEITDWKDASAPVDKEPSWLWIDADTSNVAASVQLQNENGTVMTVSHLTRFNDRKRNYAIPVDVRAKMWRLIIQEGAGGRFQLFDWGFVRWGPFPLAGPIDPPEIILGTPWKDAEAPVDKEPTWLWIDAETQGQNVQVDLQNESGVTMTVTHSGTKRNRKRNYPTPVDTRAKMWRLVAFPTGGARFQLYDWGFERWGPFSLAGVMDPPEVILWTPWQDATTPVEKEPTWLWIDAETSNAPASVQLQSDTGTTMTVSHTGTIGNRKKNYPTPVDTHAKMWRLLVNPSSTFRLYNWGFERWQPVSLGAAVDPPEVIFWTPWNDFGYPYDKLARNLILTINTENVPCAVALQTSERGTVFTPSVTTSFTNRRPTTIACPSNIDGKLWRLVLTPGSGGRAELWDWQLDAIKEPAAVTHWDSYELTLGSKFFKFVDQGWWMYTCDSPVTLTLTSGTGSMTVFLPAHGDRDTERFPLPAVWGPGFNKSKTYRVQLDAATPFKFYPGGSGLEYVIIGNDRHAAYQQSTFDEAMGFDQQ